MSMSKRSGLSEHPVIVIIATLAAIIAILAFLSGKQSLCSLIQVSGICAKDPYAQVLGSWKGNQSTLDIFADRSFVLRSDTNPRSGKVTSESDGAIYRFNFVDGHTSSGQIMGSGFALALSGDVSGNFVRVR